MRAKELVEILNKSNPDAEVLINIGDEDKNQFFELIDVDNSMAHPFTIYLGNEAQ